jgi:hypothetical protein
MILFCIQEPKGFFSVVCWIVVTGFFEVLECCCRLGYAAAGFAMFVDRKKRMLKPR